MVTGTLVSPEEFDRIINNIDTGEHVDCGKQAGDSMKYEEFVKCIKDGVYIRGYLSEKNVLAGINLISKKHDNHFIDAVIDDIFCFDKSYLFNPYGSTLIASAAAKSQNKYLFDTIIDRYFLNINKNEFMLSSSGANFISNVFDSNVLSNSNGRSRLIEQVENGFVPSSKHMSEILIDNESVFDEVIIKLKNNKTIILDDFITAVMAEVVCLGIHGKNKKDTARTMVDKLIALGGRINAVTANNDSKTNSTNLSLAIDAINDDKSKIAWVAALLASGADATVALKAGCKITSNVILSSMLIDAAWRNGYELSIYGGVLLKSLAEEFYNKECNSIEVCKQLFAHGVSYDSQWVDLNGSKKNIIAEVISWSDSKTLMKFGRRDVLRTTRDEEMISKASENCKIEFISELVREGADINSSGLVLIECIKNKNKHLTDLILDLGGDFMKSAENADDENIKYKKVLIALGDIS